MADAAALVAREVLAKRLTGRFPLLELAAAVEAVAIEIPCAVEALTGAGAPTTTLLAAAGRNLIEGPPERRSAHADAWLQGTPPEPEISFWVGVAASPVLELAAAAVEPVSRQRWSKPLCPHCGGMPQVSVIGEESGEFLAGSPRNLVCSRCASWWPWPRAVCPSCEEHDSRRTTTYHAAGQPGTRIDVCETCGGYIKTFDLREPGGKDVVPLVDDVATLSLDVWAQERGAHRGSPSLAGV